MKNIVLLVVGLLALAHSPSYGQGREGQQAARYGWRLRLEEGKAEAKRTGRPLMVVLRCEP